MTSLLSVALILGLLCYASYAMLFYDDAATGSGAYPIEDTSTTAVNK